MDGIGVKLFAGLAALSAVAGVALGMGDGSQWAIVGWLAMALFGSAAAIQANHRTGALTTALVAAGANAYLLYGKMSAVGPSACSINSYIDCDKVNSSAYSEAFGLPITLFGVGFYLGLVIWGATLSRSDEDEATFQKVSGAFALLNLAYSAFLAWASVQIGALCVVCITIYLCNALLLWASLASLGSVGALTSQLGKALSKALPTLAAVFLVTTAIGANAWSSSSELPVDTTQDPTEIDWTRLYAKPAGSVAYDGDEPLLGPENARYTVVEFADFGCPHCAAAEEELKQLVQVLPDVNVRFKVFPLSGNCNPGLAPSQDNLRCNAAFAAQCAHEQDAFWPYAHLLFVNQGYFTLPDLARIAEQVELDVDAWQTCMEAPSTRDAVLASAQAGNEAGITGTPSLFLQGTHGNDFLHITTGVQGLAAVIQAHQDGVDLPAPTATADH